MPKIIHAENDILQLLKDARFGYSIAKIAQELNYSRTTISKYLLQLQEEGKVFAQDIGQYKVWHHNDGFYKKNYECSVTKMFFQPFYASMMKNLPSFGLDDDKTKALGEEISKDMNLFELIDYYVELSTMSNESAGADEFNTLAHVIMDIIDMLFSESDHFTWQQPLIFDDESFFIVRMVGSRFIEYPAHFHLLSGLIQYQLREKANISVAIHQIVPEDKLVDIKFTIDES